MSEGTVAEGSCSVQPQFREPRRVDAKVVAQCSRGAQSSVQATSATWSTSTKAPAPRYCSRTASLAATTTPRTWWRSSSDPGAHHWPITCGYFGSSIPAHPAVEGQADAYVKLLDHLGIDKVIAVGYSAVSP